MIVAPLVDKASANLTPSAGTSHVMITTFAPAESGGNSSNTEKSKFMKKEVFCDGEFNCELSLGKARIF